MAGTTTNNGWDYPTSTDYVKDGATAIQTLATDIDTSVGTGLLAWQSWAPTLSGGWLNGNGTWTAKYCQIGKTVFVNATFTVGSTTTKGTNALVSLPVTANGTPSRLQSGVSQATVAGNGTFLTTAIWNNTTTCNISMLSTASATNVVTRANITATYPATWATGDVLTINLTYEAA